MTYQIETFRKINGNLYLLYTRYSRNNQFLFIFHIYLYIIIFYLFFLYISLFQITFSMLSSKNKMN